MALTPNQIANPKKVSQEEILMGIYEKLDEISKLLSKSNKFGYFHLLSNIERYLKPPIDPRKL